MSPVRTGSRLPLASFCLLLLGIYGTAVVLVGSGLLPRVPRLAAAITLDLTLLVPALFYLLVVRTMSLPAVSVVAAFVLSLLGASLVLPEEHSAYVEMMRMVAVPAELVLAAYAGTRLVGPARAAVHAPGGGRPDPLDAIRSAVGRMVPAGPVAGAVAHEVAVLYFALASWRARPDVRAGEEPFSYHRRNGFAGLVVAVAMASVVEMAAVHALLASWTAPLAWALTAASAYGMLWLVGHFQAVRLRPILLTDHALVVRIGLLWTARVPYRSISAVDTIGSGAIERGAPGYLRAVASGEPRLLVELRDPTDVAGPFGLTRRGVTRIGLEVDERERFAASLAERIRTGPPSSR